MSQIPFPNPNRRKEDGRPEGTYKRFRFEETKLGFFLKYEVPAVYGVIMAMMPSSPFPDPPLYLIEAVCRASKDASFKKRKFIRYLEEYEKNGLFCRRAKRMTSAREKYYEGIRKRKTEKFILRNRDRIEAMRRNNRETEAE